MNPELLRQQTKKDQTDSPFIGIGEFLVQENFITTLDCKKVLDIQEADKKLFGSSLFHILRKTGRLSGGNYQRFLLSPEFQNIFCTYITTTGLLPSRIVDHCIGSKELKQPLPEYLVEQKLLSQDTVTEIIETKLNDNELVQQCLKSQYIKADDITHATKICKGLRNFGDICCEQHLITPLDLYYILLKYNKQTKFGDILIRLGYVDQFTLQQALAEQQKKKGLLGNLLVAKQLITREQCQEALSIQANIPYDPLSEFSYDTFSQQSLRLIISPRYAEKNLIIPLHLLNNNKLTLALMQPKAINASRELANVYKQFELSCVLTTEQRFKDLFYELYEEELIIPDSEQHIEAEDEDESESNSETDFMQIELDEEYDAENKVDYDGENIQTEEIVNYIIKTGIKEGASDIHIEQDRGGATLRYRVDGVMKIHNPPWLAQNFKEGVAAIISRIKVISNLDIAEKRLPQGGVFRICYFDKRAHKKHDLDFRVATCPAITGENITIRILDSRKGNVDLDLQGHHPHVLEPFKKYLKASAGLILVTGPTGSGKSSTLYGALQYIYDPMLKIITAEDPIEYSFSGIMQTQVNLKIDLTFARLMRSFLRLDPDVIFVGEIRDAETATIAFDAAQTGHLVLSTLHTNDSISAIGRLLDLSIDRSHIAASLSCIMAQRLVRKICPACINEYKPMEKEWDLIFRDNPKNLHFFQGAGCPACENTGYKGRTLLSEIFTMENTHPIQQGASVTEIKQMAIAAGMQTMVNDGLQKLSSTTISEICRVLPFDMLEQFREDQERHNPPEISSKEFWLENPDSENTIIQAMHTLHTNLTENTTASSINFDLFKQFITTSYHEISNTHNCKLVQFRLSVEDKQVKIKASPATWSSAKESAS